MKGDDKMVNKFNLLKFIIGTIMMFFSLFFVSLALNSPGLLMLSCIIAPLSIYYFNKKINLKRKTYYLGLVGIFIATFVFLTFNLETEETKANNSQMVNAQESQEKIVDEKESTEQENIVEENTDEKAEQQKLEQERLEAEKAEQERLVAEEAERIAQEAELARQQAAAEEARLQEEAAQQNNISQMVWLSATGDKYHSINNCGRMNPSTARQVTLQEAQSGYQRCSKCW